MRKCIPCVLFLLALACSGDPAGEAGTGGHSAVNGGASGGTDGINVPNGGAAGAPKCTRVVSLSALAIERPEPFDVVIVADHSGSLSWSRDSLAAGLKNLLSYVHGQQVRFFVLTPTQYGASSEAARTAGNVPLVNWQDPVTGLPYAHAITEYRQTCTDVNGGAVDCAKRHEAEGKGLSVKGSWVFQLPPPIAAVTPEMTLVQLGEQQQKIADGILALGTDGAQIEQPICTLNRYIAQAKNELPKHAVFVLLSDEDDQSTPGQCLSGYSYQEHADGTNDVPCSQNCDTYRYTAQYSRPLQSVDYECVPVDDQGMHHPENATQNSTITSAGPTCTPGTSKSCGAEELALASEFCNNGHVPENCKATCQAANIFSCSLDRPTTSVDLCSTPFSENGTSYANLADYCAQTRPGQSPWQNCAKQGLELGASVRYLGEETVTKLVDVPTLSAMADHFRASADAAFGKGEYFVESIVLDPAFACKVGAGQSYGATLKSLATSSDDVFPLCSDYAPALQRIQTFAHHLVQNEFPLTLASDEVLDAVDAIDIDGKRRPLAASNYSYDRDRKLLSVTPGVLGPSDLSLDLTVADTCIEIIR